jgi:hypothetical protein
MLSYLTDEHISPSVAKQAARRCRGISIIPLRDWEGGHFLSASDEVVLREAHERGLTLVTFDVRTLPPLLRCWAEQGIDHSGVVLVDQRTLKQHDIGGLTTALCALWREQKRLSWTNRVLFLRR